MKSFPLFLIRLVSKQSSQPLFLALSVLIVFNPSSSFAQNLSVEDFLAPPTLLTASVSPSGKYVASVWQNEGTRSIVVYDRENDKIISNVGDNIIRPYSVVWVNDERIIAKFLVPYSQEQVRKDSIKKADFNIDDYAKFGRMIAMDISGANSVNLINDRRSVRRNRNLLRITSFLPKDPAHILMPAYKGQFLYLYKVNIYTGNSERIAKGGPFTVTFLKDTESDKLYRFDLKPIAKKIVIYALTDNDWETVDTIYYDEDDSDKNKIKLEDYAGVLNDELIYLKRNPDTGFRELVSTNQGEQKVVVSLANRDIVGVITKRFSGEVVGYQTLEDIYRSHYFDEKTQTKYDAAANLFDNENFIFSSMSKNRDVALLKSWGESNPITYFIRDLNTNVTQKFGYPYANLPKEKLAKGVKLQFEARDGLSLSMYVYLPPSFDGSKAFPAVMMPHGGPQARDVLTYDDFAQFVSTRGYVVIQPNFRGSTGYGKAFEVAGYKEWGGLMQDDLEDAINFLVKGGVVDKNRACIVGGSYGGYAALMGAIKTPNMYRCAISINGVTHLPKQVKYDLKKFDSDELQEYIKDSIGDPKSDKSMLEARSPALMANRVDIPILLIHGDEDGVVPYSQAKIMNKALLKNDKNVTFITLEKTGHAAFYYKEDKEAIYQAIEVFLKENLTNVNKGG